MSVSGSVISPSCCASGIMSTRTLCSGRALSNLVAGKRDDESAAWFFMPAQCESWEPESNNFHDACIDHQAEDSLSHYNRIHHLVCFPVTSFFFRIHQSARCYFRIVNWNHWMWKSQYYDGPCDRKTLLMHFCPAILENFTSTTKVSAVLQASLVIRSTWFACGISLFEAYNVRSNVVADSENALLLWALRFQFSSVVWNKTGWYFSSLSLSGLSTHAMFGTNHWNTFQSQEKT